MYFNNMAAKTQLQLLTAILDKTTHIRGGLDARDMDIVMNALDEREVLITEYANGNFSPLTGDCIALAVKINGMNEENNANLKKLMDECNEGLMEARRKIQELKTGRKATVQYYGAATANRGAAFDFKQ